MSTSDELVTLDGQLMPIGEATISVEDEGLLRGDGVFEVIRIYGGRAFELSAHLDRLERSAAGIRLELSDRSQFEQEIAELLAARGRGDYVLRLVCTRRGRRIAMTEPMPKMPLATRLAFVEYSPSVLLDGLKTLSYGANVLATRIAKERGFDEALLVRPDGEVLEAPTATIFWVDREDVLCTPPIEEGILASITRNILLSLTRATERTGTREDLADAKEAFLASTLREVQPVSAIEDTVLPIWGEHSKRAVGLFSEYLAATVPDAAARPPE